MRVIIKSILFGFVAISTQAITTQVAETRDFNIRTWIHSMGNSDYSFRISVAPLVPGKKITELSWTELQQIRNRPGGHNIIKSVKIPATTVIFKVEDLTTQNNYNAYATNPTGRETYLILPGTDSFPEANLPKWMHVRNWNQVMFSESTW